MLVGWLRWLSYFSTLAQTGSIKRGIIWIISTLFIMVIYLILKLYINVKMILKEIVVLDMPGKACALCHIDAVHSRAVYRLHLFPLFQPTLQLPFFTTTQLRITFQSKQRPETDKLSNVSKVWDIEFSSFKFCVSCDLSLVLCDQCISWCVISDGGFSLSTVIFRAGHWTILHNNNKKFNKNDSNVVKYQENYVG